MLNHLSLQKDFQGKNKLHNFHSANIYCWSVENEGRWVIVIYYSDVFT